MIREDRVTPQSDSFWIRPCNHGNKGREPTSFGSYIDENKNIFDGFGLNSGLNAKVVIFYAIFRNWDKVATVWLLLYDELRHISYYPSSQDYILFKTTIAQIKNILSCWVFKVGDLHGIHPAEAEATSSIKAARNNSMMCVSFLADCCRSLLGLEWTYAIKFNINII